MKLIEMNMEKIIALCKKHKVAKLWVFGSILAMCIAMLSCDGREGYINDGQEAILEKLAAAEWILQSEESEIFGVKTYEGESRIYKFSRDGKGWTAWGSMADASPISGKTYFQWAFTNPTFSVIQTTGNAIEGFWLIQKLTASELWAQWTPQDPILHPNQDATFYRFKSSILSSN
ncbi:MAG: hypothetical protein NC102_01440 [Clostridium sp.]|nr:hypothetical protein [Clostridium sp.]